MTTDGTVPQLLTIPELVERLGTSTRHIRRLIDERRIPYLKVGKLIRFDADEINRWLDDTRVPLQPPPTVARPTRLRPVQRRARSDGAA